MERVPSMPEVVADSRDIADQASRSSKKRSKVWDYVDNELVDGKEKAICKFCKIHLSNVPGQGTSHLNRHVGFTCLEIPQEDRDRFLKTLKTKSAQEDQSIFDPEVCRSLIAKFFVSAEIAFRKADDPSWKELMSYCHPSFRVVGRQSVRADILSLYEEERHLLIDRMAGLKSHVSLTADLWTSNQNLGYLCITSHFVDENFELHKKIIAFKQISFPHTSYAVQDGITSCLLEWGLIGKVFTLTLDNATVNDRAVKDMRGVFGSEMFMKAEFLHVRCAAHVLNIMVQQGVKIISRAIAGVRDILKVVTSTPSRLQIFNSIAEKCGLKTKSGMTIDVPHRWNATYDMLHEALEYKVALDRFAVEQYQAAPTEVDWEKAEALHSFLQAFSEATKAFSADKHPTAHLFLKLLLAVRDVLLEESWNEDELQNAMANAMYSRFEKYWAEPSIVLMLAAVLDPSMKMDFLRFYFYTVSSQEVEAKMRELKGHLNRFYMEYVAIVRRDNGLQTTASDQNVATNGSGSTSVGGPFLGKRRVELAFAQFASERSDSYSQRSELDKYLDDPRVILNSGENFDVLGWWKKNSDAYPILSLMARDFLAIPVSTVSSESAFSMAGRIIGKERTSLAPGTLEALICSKDWFIGFTEEDEGQPMEGRRFFDQEDEEDGTNGWACYY